jgi:hypothetical protein
VRDNRSNNTNDTSTDNNRLTLLRQQQVVYFEAMSIVVAILRGIGELCYLLIALTSYTLLMIICWPRMVCSCLAGIAVVVALVPEDSNEDKTRFSKGNSEQQLHAYCSLAHTICDALMLMETLTIALLLMAAFTIAA